MKKIVSLLLVFVLVISLVSAISITASAAATSTVNAFDVPTDSKYAMVYTIATSGRTTPYTSSSLSTRGTITYGKSSTAYIDNSSDQLYLLDAGITNGKSWAKISFPLSGSKRAQAYIPLSAISTASYAKSQLYYASAAGKFYCAARKGGATNSSYYVNSGETVYVFSVASTSGTNVQIMYPAAGKWRIAYCTYNDARKYLDKVTNSTSASQTTSNSKVSFNYSSNESFAKTTSSSVNLKINGTAIANGSTFYTYNKSGTQKTTSGNYNTYGYVKVGNNIVYVGSAQCQAYVRYCQNLLYGSSYMTASSKFPNLISNTTLTSSTAKTYITKAGTGAHIRTKSGHSIFVLSVDNNGFYFTDANATGGNVIRVGHYTWSGFANSNYAKIDYIEIYKK